MTPSEPEYIKVLLRYGVRYLIDLEDYRQVKQFPVYGCQSEGGLCYVVVGVPVVGEDGLKHRRHMLLARLIKGLDFGNPLEVDHINGNPLDNRKINLRVCPHGKNALNRRMRHDNTSGLKGVTQVGPNRWAASIASEGKCHYLGVYNAPEKAHKAYCEAAVWLHGEFANFGEERDEDFRLVHIPRPDTMPEQISAVGFRQHQRSLASRTGFIIRPREERPAGGR